MFQAVCTKFALAIIKASFYLRNICCALHCGRTILLYPHIIGKNAIFVLFVTQLIFSVKQGDLLRWTHRSCIHLTMSHICIHK